jgi:type III secretion protein U
VSDKTEEPTPRRLRKAREEGDSGVSAFAAQALAFLVAMALVPSAVRALVERSSAALKRAIQSEPSIQFDPWTLVWDVIVLSVPVLLAAGIVAAVMHVVQTGGAVASKRLTPKLERLDVIQGIKNLFSPSRLFAVARAMLGAAVVAWLAHKAIVSHVIDLARLPGRLPYIGKVAGELALDVARAAAIVGVVLGAVDLVVTRFQWMRRLRMTKDEVKREHKESEGDPHMKAARERAHHEMMAAATIGNVKNATVVIVNPTHLATALRYDEKEGDEAPVVVASGEGDLARKIIEAAEDYGVPVVRDVPLARALAELQPGDTIPEALYEAVAEILREIWSETGETP